MKSYMVEGQRQIADDRRRATNPLLLRLRPLLPLPLLLPLFLLLSTPGRAQDDLFPPKPEPAVYVHDYAGWLSDGEKMTLEQKLRRYFDSTSTQIVVMIRADIGDYDKASYAFELGNRWGIGRKSKNNGVVLLVKTEQPGRGAFIATGYGVEGALPDITAGRIVRNTMIPYFQQKQYARGIEAGTDDIIRALSGEFKNDEAEGTPIPWWVPVLIVFLIFVFVFVMVKLAKKSGGTWYAGSGMPRRSNRRHDDWGGGFGGGGGGGSDWGGGGGSFGGGSFGGGGAGGDW